MKPKNRIISMILVAVVAMAAFSFSAFAQDYYASDESGKPTIPEYIESISVSTEGVNVPETGEKNTFELTPDGNLNLIDDYSEIEASDSKDGGSKQFLTVTTKSGNTFYIVVDRDGNSENVHFLNMVDEADLMALINDEEAKCNCSDKCVDGKVNTSCPVCKNNMSACGGKEVTTDAEETTSAEGEENTEKKSGSGAVIFAVIAVAGGGFAFYWFKLRNKDDKTEQADNSGFDSDDDYADNEPEAEYDPEFDVDVSEDEENEV